MMADLPAFDAPRKRSVVLDGHATSVSLEDAFWEGVQILAAREGLSRAQFITRIDHARPADVGLATALRLTVLAGLRA